MVNHSYLSRIALYEAYGLDTLGEFRDLLHLVQLIRQLVKKELHMDSQVFVWTDHLEVYRNWEREDVMTISRENPLITYMVLENRTISTTERRVKAFFEEAPELCLFFESEQIHYLLPVVYQYQLLGFVALKGDTELSSEQKHFCRLLRETLKQYMYSALLMERRLQDMLGLSYFTKELGNTTSVEEVYKQFFDLLVSLLPISRGVFYCYDEFGKQLKPVGMFSVSDVPILEEKKGISWFVLERGKPLLVNDLAHQPFLLEKQKEENFLGNAILVLPLIQETKKWGILTLTRENGSFSADHLYIGRIISQIVVTILASKYYYEQLEHNYFDTIKALTLALEAKDSYTRGHSERVLQYVTWMAEELGVSQTTLRNLQYAAVLHDIGKIGIDEHIIRKAGRLTREEYEKIKHHPEIGDKILSSVDFLKEAREYVHYHHERLDGSGYYGKREGEFPWETMLVVLADIFDALTSDRLYRHASSYEKALEILQQEVGITFDRKVYDAFVSALEKHNMIKTKSSF